MNASGSRAPDFIEPIVAYRAWRYFARDGVVQLGPVSVSASDAVGASGWDGAARAWVTASCRFPSSPHDAPDEACTCGFYAMKDPFHVALVDLMWQPPIGPFVEREGYVLGRVELAGKVIEHEFGFRAERARIAELTPIADDNGMTHWIASLLELSVGAELDIAAMVRAGVVADQLGANTRATPLGPLERIRLASHIRRFRLIQGGRANGGSPN